MCYNKRNSVIGNCKKTMHQRNLWQLVLGAIALALILVGVIYYFVLPKPGLREKIMLSVSSDKSTYGAGEEIRFTLQLSNTGDVESCASNLVEGNIRVVSLTRNGEEVTTRSAPISFIEHLSLLLEKSLAVLRPGESLDIAMASWVDPGLEKQALRTVALSKSESVATFYDVDAPGDYNLTFVYEYPGTSSPDCPDVFQGETNQDGIVFTVTP